MRRCARAVLTRDQVDDEFMPIYFQDTVDDKVGKATFDELTAVSAQLDLSREFVAVLRPMLQMKPNLQLADRGWKIELHRLALRGVHLQMEITSG